jgi:gliding motility-associated-like protein
MHKVLTLTFMLLFFNAVYGQQRLIYNKFHALVPAVSVSAKINTKVALSKKPQDTPPPTVTIGPISGSIKTCFRTASTTYQQFTISGDNLTSDLKISVPISTWYDDGYSPPKETDQAGYEISTSTDPNSFSYAFTLPETNGRVNPTTIYIRMAADITDSTLPAILLITSNGIDISGPNFPFIKGTQVPLADVEINNQTICNNTATTKIVFKGRSEETTAKSYPWVNDNPAVGLAASGTGEVPSFIGRNPGNTPLWANITVTPVADCMGTPRTFHIVINPTLHPVLTVSTLTPVVCEGATITFTVTPENVGDLPIYKWHVNDQPDGGNVITGDHTLIYTSDKLKNGDKITCTVTGNTYCYTPVTSDPFIVKMIPLPEVHFNTSSYTINPGQSVQLNPIANASVSGYSWSPAAGLSNPNIANPVASPDKTTIYQLLTTTAGGCNALASITVYVVPKPVDTDIGIIPNTFTPNGDGTNDTWAIPKLIKFPSCTVMVYNRYGSLVYQSTGYAKFWDGSFRSKPLPVGSYYYVIDLKVGSSIISGSVFILK